MERIDMDYKRGTNDEKFRLNFSVCANRNVAALYYFTSHQFWKRAIIYRGWRWTGPEVTWPSSWCQKVRYPLSFSCCNFGISLGALILQLFCHFFHRPVISEIFYLLADFYFKNKEFRYSSDFKYFSLPLDGFEFVSPEFNSSVCCK